MLDDERGRSRSLGDRLRPRGAAEHCRGGTAGYSEAGEKYFATICGNQPLAASFDDVVTSSRLPSQLALPGVSQREGYRRAL